MERRRRAAFQVRPGHSPALDDLVLALINPEPALRPNAAFEVMQLLAACAGLVADESDAVPRAYLITPSLVGRSELLASTASRALDSCATTRYAVATSFGLIDSRG